MADRLTSRGLQRLHAAAAQHVSDDQVPGLAALVASDDEVHVEALGTLAAGGKPVTRGSLFRIASMTKPVTAVATLVLIEQGLLRLDEPVDRLLPELAGRRVLRQPGGPLDDTVPADRAITVRDLLTFTFGFGVVMDMFTTPGPWPVVAAEQELGLSTIGPPDRGTQPGPDEWIAGLGSLPLIAQPGERWMYNTGSSVLGVLLERAARQPFGEVLRTQVFEPLGMSDTAFWASDPGRLATAYRPSAEGLQVWDEPDGQYSAPPAFCDGAAGLVSTVDDFLAFSRMMLRGGAPILPASAVAAMTSDQLTPAQKAHGGITPEGFAGMSWGFGQAVWDDGSFGWDGGFGSLWRADPAQDLTVIALTQVAFTSPEPPAVLRDIQAAAQAALGD